jgi:hypothetical protein
LILALSEWAEDLSTFEAREFDHSHLRQNARCGRNDTMSLDKLLKMQLPEGVDFFNKRQLCDSHENFGMYVAVAGERVVNKLGGSFVHDFEHNFGHFRQKVSKRVSFGSEVREFDFERLSVFHHHLVNGFLEDRIAVFVSSCAKILDKAQVQFSANLRLLDPFKKRVAFSVFDIFNLFVLFSAIFVAIKSSTTSGVINLEF